MSNWYFADFETTSVTESCKKVKVYLWGVVKGEEQFQGENIESFIEFCEKTKGVMWFHNLKFDSSFILDYLLRNDIKFSILEKNGVIYSLKFFKIEIRDTLNFLNITLKEIGEKFCSVYKKGSLEDYAVPYNHVATQEEKDYNILDCLVLQEGFNNFLSSLEKVLEEAQAFNTIKKIPKKLTIAGLSFEAFKELSNFDKCCPKTNHNQYEFMKEAYKGGYVYSKPCGILENIKMIDANSMYPYVYATKKLPIGKPIYLNTWEELNKFDFYIVKIRICYELKKGYIPIIGGGVSRYTTNNYKSSSNGEFEEITVCNIDLERIKRYYDCEIILGGGCAFETKKEFYKNYADIFIKMKNTYGKNDIHRQVSKYLLNSPYGKLAMNGFQEIKQWKIGKDDWVIGEVVGYSLEDESYKYLPQAIAITAYAREHLLNTAEKIGFENVYYMDTDSIKFRGELKGLWLDDNELGAWKLEGEPTYFKTIAPICLTIVRRL